MFDQIINYSKANILTDVGFFDLVNRYILNLIRTDFDALVNLLYRLDVDENKVKVAFLLKDDQLIAEAVSKLIIALIDQKNKLRAAYQNKGLS